MRSVLGYQLAYKRVEVSRAWEVVVLDALEDGLDLVQGDYGLGHQLFLLVLVR